VEQSGINKACQNAVKQVGLSYPPNQASRGSCSPGGNLTHRSGGLKAVKYGTIKDHVLNLEVVLPTSDII
jgi:glycolate oxidase